MEKNKNKKSTKRKKYLPPGLEKYKVDELSKDWDLEAMMVEEGPSSTPGTPG